MIVSIQSAYKMEGHWDLIIVDEAHRSLSPKYRAMYTGLTCEYLMCLTATKPKDMEYLEFLQSVAPIVYEKRLLEAVAEEVLPKFKVINMEVPFHRASAGRYRIFDQQFREAVIAINRFRGKYPELRKYKSVFDLAKDFKVYRRVDEFTELGKEARKFWSAMTMRKYAVYNNLHKIDIAVKIVNAYPERKWILFCKSINFATTLASRIPGALLYHSELKTPEKKAILRQNAEAERGVLVAVDALNEGYNVENIDAAICLSGVSTELVNIQQLGRTLRPKQNIPLFINFYTKDSVEEGWVNEKTKGLGGAVTWLNSEKKGDLKQELSSFI